jgi:ankyrin repeat protein
MRFVTCALAGLLVVAPSSPAVAAGSDVADAAQRKDGAAVRALVAKRANIDAAQADGSTALLWAAHWNDVDIVKLLLRAGANAGATNRFGASALSEAATAGHAELVRLLLEAGADAKALSTPDGETVLMSAARSGSVESVRLLLDRGADVNARERYKGQTALMWAAAERHAPVVALLLERGADWKVRGFDRETKPPRLSAASAISPIPRGGFTALMFAAREGDLESARIMLDAGVDINHGDVDQVTPLVAAIMNKQYTLARFLVERGADVNIVDAGGRTALYAMIDIRNEDWTAMPNRTTDDPVPTLEVVKAIIERGATLDVPLTRPLTVRSGMDFGDTTLGDGATPLMRAARAGDHEVIRLLLAKGANPRLTTKGGSNALMFAAGIGYRDKNTRGGERDALEAVKVLQAAGLDLAQANGIGENALHGAALRGANTIVQYLVDQGLDVNATSSQGYTPLDVAMGKTIVIQLPVPQEATVALLKKLGGKEGPGPRAARPAAP